MSDHVVYGKPLVVTEERLREAREKQVKQKALKEALDRQIAQSKRHRLDNDALGKKDNVVRGDAIRQQYKFSYKDGHGKFILQNDGPELHEHPTQTVLSTFTVNNANNNNAAALNIIPGHRKPLDLLPNKRPPYQSNSLPPNFSMSTSEANPLAPKRTEYDTNSLPLDFVYNSKKQDGGLVKASPKARESFPLGVSPKRSPRTVGLITESSYQTNCLPRNFSLEDVKRLLPEGQASPHPSPPQQSSPLASPGLARQVTGVAPPSYSRANAPAKHHVGCLPPLEVADGLAGRRKSGEPPPALEPVGSPPRELLGAPALNGKSSGRPKLKQLSTPRRPSNDARGRPSAGGLAPRNGQARATERKVEQLQKELESRDFQMARMREKEKNWEEQVKQLKIELKSARKKERDLNKLVKEGPRRAETAPDQPIVSAPMLGSPGQPLKKGLGAPLALGPGRRQKFAKSCIFNQETFRPISAPSDAVSTSFVPQQQNIVSLMQDSFKCASALTRKTAFGLPEENANRPVPIEYHHLLQFVKEQIITQQQADALWRLFSNEDSPLTLIHRQSSTVKLSGEVAVNSTDSYLVLENRAKAFSSDDNEEKRKQNEVEEDEDEDEDEEADVEEENKLVCSNGHVHEELGTEDGTFETFAELHLGECPSLDETGEE
ncbi:uncharacterized protein Tco025E_04730 [Trypanosoma conorhini]|uniref:Uncharacterized protein n=1 Tax=Trypanosoma conorhini TaxID=83891 RepID=A0A3S5ITG4_9TRYP|nr:uncharacterized protein Tco025E_04730 [Trypanosoma conorhini]RNF17787.1 hypothetical protein Tco025E_04730 [Trypanosoma conorhini]